MPNTSQLTGAIFLAISSFSVFAADNVEGWTFLTDTNDSNFYAKMRSFTESKGIRSIIIQQVPISRASHANILYSRFTISTQACKNEYGRITLYNLSGKVTNQFDYVKGGSSAAAYIADIVCQN